MTTNTPKSIFARLTAAIAVGLVAVIAAASVAAAAPGGPEPSEQPPVAVEMTDTPGLVAGSPLQASLNVLCPNYDQWTPGVSVSVENTSAEARVYQLTVLVEDNGYWESEPRTVSPGSNSYEQFRPPLPLGLNTYAYGNTAVAKVFDVASGAVLDSETFSWGWCGTPQPWIRLELVCQSDGGVRVLEMHGNDGTGVWLPGAASLTADGSDMTGLGGHGFIYPGHIYESSVLVPEDALIEVSQVVHPTYPYEYVEASLIADCSPGKPPQQAASQGPEAGGQAGSGPAEEPESQSLTVTEELIPRETPTASQAEIEPATTDTIGDFDPDNSTLDVVEEVFNRVAAIIQKFWPFN